MIATDIDFPKSLPCPLKEGYGLEHVSTFARTDMESGRARNRRKFTSVPSMTGVAWIFNDAQAQAFEAWFRDAIQDGADWFNCDLKSPIGEKPYVCRFTDMYKGPEPIGAKHWKITAKLEIWERPLLAPGWGLVPDFVAGMSIFDIAMNREWPEA